MTNALLTTVEFCLTYDCNLRCNNCTSLVSQAPCNYGTLTIETVQAFIDDCITNKDPFSAIVLHGGEPTMHPEFSTICDMFLKYLAREKDKRVDVNICTNGNDRKIVSYYCRKGFGLSSSPKIANNVDANGNLLAYFPINESAIDEGKPYPVGCEISRHCGICYNYLGFFACSPAAAMARVFEYTPVAHTISELSIGKMEESFIQVCRHCGRGRTDTIKKTEQSSSKTWLSALDDYKKRHNLP